MSFTPSHTFHDGDIPTGSDFNEIATDINTQCPTLTANNTLTGNNTFSGNNTFTGTELFVCVPSPSWYSQLRPQHLTPVPVDAQVCAIPAASIVAPLDNPETVTGVKLLLKVPSPSCPAQLRPQQLTAPPEVSAHVCSLPAAMATAPFDKPTTFTGMLLLVVVPSPNCPVSFLPQHLTPPALVIAQV